VSGEWILAATNAINGAVAAATPYLVGTWDVAAGAGTVYSYRLLRKARRDRAYQVGRSAAAAYSAESTVGRVWIRTKTFVEFLVIGLCATMLLLPVTDPLLLLLRAIALLVYLCLFISVIAQLAYNAWRDDRRDTHLRHLLDAQYRERQTALDAAHTLRRVLADQRQPEGEAEKRMAT
jgi:drug/metabolite transporter (DMT)-like permease